MSLKRTLSPSLQSDDDIVTRLAAKHSIDPKVARVIANTCNKLLSALSLMGITTIIEGCFKMNYKNRGGFKMKIINNNKKHLKKILAKSDKFYIRITKNQIY